MSRGSRREATRGVNLVMVEVVREKKSSVLLEMVNVMERKEMVKMEDKRRSRQWKDTLVQLDCIAACNSPGGNR